MKIENFNNGLADIQHLIADEGKEFIRKTDLSKMGSEIYLGMNYHADPPRMDTAEDFDEIEINEEEET